MKVKNKHRVIILPAIIALSKRHTTKAPASSVLPIYAADVMIGFALSRGCYYFLAGHIYCAREI